MRREKMKTQGALDYGTAFSFYGNSNFDSAVEYFKKAGPVLDEEGQYRQSSVCNRMIATCYGRLRNHEKERQYIERARNYAEQHRLGMELARIYQSSSISSYHKGNFKESLEYANLALEYLPQRPTSENEINVREECLAGKCISMVRLGQLEDTEEYANDLLDTLTIEKNKNVVRQSLARIYEKTNRKAEALKIVNFLIEISNKVDPTLHLLRASITGGGATAKPDVMQAVKAEEKKLANIHDELNRKVFIEESASRSVYSRALDIFTRGSMLEEAFVVVGKIKSRAFAKNLPWKKKISTDPARVISKGYVQNNIKEMQNLLREREACLDIYVEDSHTLLFLITKTSHKFEKVMITGESIKAYIDEIIFNVIHKGTAFLYEALMRELCRKVFGSILSGLDGEEKLIIIPHRYFHDLSFTGFNLGLDLSYLPNLSTMKLLCKTEARPYKKCLILGDPDSDLPKAVTESRAIALHYGTNATVLLKNEATIENLEKLAGKADVIHMACHAEYNESNPALSCVFLRNKDGERWPLNTQQIQSMNLSNVSLVVLSSCESGRGRIAGLSDELISVPRAFLTAGAKGVLVTFGKVQDHNATHDLMDEFHRLVTSGTNPAKALRLAQDKVRRQHPHPYFWAGFQYIGV